MDRGNVPARVGELWARPEVATYTRRLLALDPGDAPMQSFVGFNMTPDRILTAKVNHHHFVRLPENELRGLVPVRSVFDRYYPKWQPDQPRSRKETGSAFVVKVAPGSPATYQFHFRFPFQEEDFAELGLASHEIDFRRYTLNPGISFEHTGEEVLRKLYYYLEDPGEKAIIARQFGEPWAQEAAMLEYTQTDKARKVILWNFFVDQTRAYIRNVGWPILDELVEFMDGFGCSPMFPGIYEGGGVRAIYFFRFPVASDDPWSLEENHQIRTLEHLPLLSEG